MWLRHCLLPRHAQQRQQHSCTTAAQALVAQPAVPWPSQLHHHYHHHHHSLASSSPRRTAAAATADAADPSTPAAPLPPPQQLRLRSHVRRCRTVFTLCDALAHEGARLPPRTWVTALVHLVDLVEQHGQHMTPNSWRQLRDGLHSLLGLQQQQQQQLPPPPPPPPEQQQQQQNGSNGNSNSGGGGGGAGGNDQTA